MDRKIMAFLLLIFISSCNSKETESKYLRWVGDIAEDLTIDDPDFEVCREKKAMQYFNFSRGLQYKGEKYALEKEVREKYDPGEVSPESGLIRIRFIVNCKGQTGRFRITAMDSTYQEKQFDTLITEQLLSIVRGLKGWKMMPDNENPKDYYQYLIFKIDNGQIIEILP